MSADHAGERRQSGVDLIAAERQRQIEVEGWTPEHDAEHDDHEMAYAAAWYARRAYSGSHPATNPEPEGWPWNPEWWKPSDDPIRNLVKAGALIAAEIDRLNAADPPCPVPGCTMDLHISRGAHDADLAAGRAAQSRGDAAPSS